MEEPNYELAEKIIKRLDEWSDECEFYFDDYKDDLHVFSFGWVRYEWNGLDAEYDVVVELRPTVENGEVTAYEVVHVERVA